jgi:small subunit ribosomal protein S9
MSAPLKSATGRRKTAVARVHLRTGHGQIMINGRPLDDYFPTQSLQNMVTLPLQLTATRSTYDIDVNATGGGLTGQVGAVRLGISRALIAENPEYRGLLKPHGLLTRDSRAKERKKSGQPGARKRFQFSKR